MDILYTHFPDFVDSEITQTPPDKAVCNLGLRSRLFSLKCGGLFGKWVATCTKITFCWRPYLVKWQEMVWVDGQALGQISINWSGKERHQSNMAKTARACLLRKLPVWVTYLSLLTFYPVTLLDFPFFPLRKLVIMSFLIHICALQSDKNCEGTMSILGHMLWVTVWWSAFKQPRWLNAEFSIFCVENLWIWCVCIHISMVLSVRS